MSNVEFRKAQLKLNGSFAKFIGTGDIWERNTLLKSEMHADDGTPCDALKSFYDCGQNRQEGLRVGRCTAHPDSAGNPRDVVYRVGAVTVQNGFAVLASVVDPDAVS